MPGSTRNDLWRASPSTSTRPSPSRRSAVVRDPTPSRPATNRSSRAPRWSSGTGASITAGVRSILREAQQEQDHAEHDERVGEVEDRPVVDVQEVGDAVVADAVDEVRAAHRPPAGRPPAGSSGLRAPERAKKTNIHAMARQRQDHHDLLLLRELAERDAGVLDAPQVEERQQLDDLAAVDGARRERLRDLVGHHRDDRDREQSRPTPAARRAEAAGRGDSGSS